MKKSAIVTGASRGIGRAVARRLAKDGFAVVVNYVSNAAEAEEAVAEIKKNGGEAVAIKADVGNPADVEQLFAETLKKFGSVDVVVNNSGIMPLSPIGKGDVEAFDKVIATNLRGTFLVFTQAARHISTGGRIIAFSSSVLAKSFPSYGPYIASKAGSDLNLRGTFLVFTQAARHISTGGRIIAFSSSVLAKSFPSYGPYIASKAGVEGLVHVLANELRGRKVSVNAVAPGPIATELFLNGKTENQ